MEELISVEATELTKNGIELKAYEIPQETLCKAFQKAHKLLHLTEEQTKWWTDHKKEINNIMCLNLKPEETI